MTDELKPVRCGCGGEAKVEEWVGRWYVRCQKSNCLISTKNCDTEAEAIEAWNRAMGTNTRRLLEVLVHDATDTNVGNKERTAKVVTEEKPIEGSDNYIAVTSCGACGNVVSLFDTYCSGCGCRLEWK